jgi:hypothetical protein
MQKEVPNRLRDVLLHLVGYGFHAFQSFHFASGDHILPFPNFVIVNSFFTG